MNQRTEFIYLQTQSEEELTVFILIVFFVALFTTLSSIFFIDNFYVTIPIFLENIKNCHI